MRVFKSIEDVESAGLPPPAHALVHRVVKNFIDALAAYGQDYDPDDDGYTLLIEGGDEGEVAAEIGYPLAEALFEGVTREGGFYVGCILHNNQFGYSLIIEDSKKLDPAVRAKLVDEYDAGAAR
jgi:hypothetical protein